MHKAPTKDEEPFRAFELKRVEYTAKVEVARKSMYKYRNAKNFLKLLKFSRKRSGNIQNVYLHYFNALSHKVANATETV